MRFLLPLSVALIGMTGCAHWTAAEGDPWQAIQASAPSRVRITDTTGTRVVLDAPRVVGDSVTGVLSGSAPGGTRLREHTMATASVAHVEVREGDLTRTVGFVAGAILWVGGAALLVGF